MKAVGFDSCVVLRLLVGEPAHQASQAKEYLEVCYFKGVTVYISDLVVAEAYHALYHHYNVPRDKVRKHLRDFLASPMITPTGHALTVLSEYTEGGAGFVDRLIRMDCLYKADEVMTFDKNFEKLANVSIIKSAITSPK